MRKKIFTFLLALAASVGMMNAAVDGKLPGAFTVNAGGDQVYFSQGNLQYQASTNTWRFAEHQYDFIGDAAGNNTESGRNTQSDWIDLFGWATSGNSASGTAYQPWQSSTTDSEYGPAITSGQWTYANSDWGINPISNGGNVANSWRTLTQEEWDYILNSRSTDYRFCYAKLSIGDDLGYGLIILPDDWDPNYYALSSMNEGNHNYDSNEITAEDWTNSLEAHGAVFLPITGMRYNGNEVIGLDDDKIGLYWSSIAAERHEVIEDPEGPMNIDIVNAAYNLVFNGGWYIRANQVTTRSRGLAVRLVYTEPSGDPTPHPHGACGAQGDNLLWELNTSTGVLTITGSGAMYDWAYNTDLPWYDNILQITSVVLPSGITSIGTKAFRGCQNLASINMTENYPAGLTVIKQEAFCNTKLTSVIIPESVVTIGQDAFYRSENITDVYCYADPNNLTWNDSGCDDFTPAKSTQCHVKDCYLAVYNSKWNTSSSSTDVNVTFVGDLPGDCPTPTPTPAQGGDKLSGAFSVDDGKVVYFSKGNLQATTNDLGATWTWAFAANQYDYIGKAAANNAINGNGTVSTNGTVDLFGWSTSSTVYGIHNSTNTYTYSGNFADWSSNTNLIASLGGDWRTLTSGEWNYLLNTRTTTSGVRYAKATVNTVAGLIILPDNWNEAYHALASTNDPDVGFSGNEINSATWTSDFQAHGAVFLPAAGNRQGTNVSNAGSAGYYWSAISTDGYTADYMYFNASELSASSFNSRHNGWSVRLVSEIAPIPTSGSCGNNLTWEFNTETGALTISGTGAMTSAPWETYYKAAITSLSLPDGLTAIPSEAFQGCTGLTTVTIPASVTSIGADAFHGCTSVKDVYCYPKAADLDWNDYYTDDFIEYPAIETRCHVYADECSEYIARYSQGDGVNVTFMNDLEAVAVTTNEDPQNPAVYYSTFYHGTQKYRLPNDGTEAYVADLSGSDLRLTKIAEGNKVLPNGVAVILKAPGTKVTLFPTEAEPVTFTAPNSLQGVDAETTAPANTYVLSGTPEHGVGFYRINSENLKAHKAYVIYNGSAAPKRMRFIFNQEQIATGVDQVPSDQVQSTKILRNGQLVIIKNGVKYNAQGQIVK